MVSRTSAQYPSLGMGAYTLADAARYASMPGQTIRTWFNGRSDGQGRGPVLKSDYRSVKGDVAVSFLDLIDAYVAGQFRRAGVKMAVIRQAYDVISADLRTKHPFAMSDLYTDGRRVITCAADELGDESLHDVITQQRFFEQFKNLLQHIEYHDSNRLAARWLIHEGVMIDPRVSFGKPVIKDTGVHTRVLARQFYANGEDASLVADLYGVSEMDVLRAVDFEGRLGRRDAA